jgi:hypothetical protein
MESKLTQVPRLSYTLSYKGVVVGGMNEYHPEKVDFTLTRSIDYIEGESPEDLQKRLEAMRETEKVLVQHVEASIGEKIAELRKRTGT